MSKKKDVIIIGGGASGLFAAIICAKAGKKVLILEHKDRIGKKLLATGNGKCNYTNLLMPKGCYRGEHPEFVSYALNIFGAEDTITFFKELGIFPKNKNGYIYPNSEQAASVLEVMEMALSYYHVQIVCKEEVTEIIPEKKGFTVKGNQGTYQGENIILAAGGQVSAKLGSDGSGYKLAKKLGHKVIKPVPALIGFKCKENYFKELAGVRTEAEVSLFIDDLNHYVAKDRGELQLTNYGISGIPVFQISRFGSRAIKDRKKVFVKIDFLPNMEKEEVYKLIWHRFRETEGKTASQAMIGLLNKKLCSVLLAESKIDLHSPSKEISKRQQNRLVDNIKGMCITILDTNGYENAQVTAGGIDTEQIEKRTMESKLVPGLYFAGEIVDVDGICGGYNLQWCWSSAYTAAKDILS
ncbi:MAG: NAD(P)/FAD-dependent oxidoreductase [Lachnospiraceae bacterium]|nr:NAD(P)/FAD-dependent oxidoreductase [Lachnospiraceae bacterium]